jgi:four helix bundle protein
MSNEGCHGMKDFRQLKAWQKSHELTLEVYRCTLSFSRDEIYGLTPQIRPAASSISATIAEVSGRGGDPELRPFLTIAYSSPSELDRHLILAKDLAYLTVENYEHLYSKLVELQRMLHSFINKLKVVT